MASYKIIFAGTPEFSCTTLQSLLQSEHEVLAVYTQPDRPSGRGRQVSQSPVKDIALIYDLPIEQPLNFRDPADQKILSDYKADFMIVVAYGILLPKVILEAPKFGCLNIHASLLPRFRGAAPIQRALLSGDKKTGVTIMQMDTGLDTGPMLYKEECDIFETDTSQTLHDRLAELGSDALLYTLENYKKLKPEMQNNSHTTYAHKLTKEEAKIDWQKSAATLALEIRGFNPRPISYTTLDDNVIRIYEANVISKNPINAKIGEIVAVSADGIDVVTGKDILQITQLQLSGGRVLSARELLNGRHDLFQLGQCFT